MHPRDVARVLRGQHQLRPRALSSARLELVVVWLDQRVHLAAAVSQLHQSERDHAVHRVHLRPEIWGDLGRYGEIWGGVGRCGEILREIVVEVDLVVCEDCGEACRRDERLNGRLNNEMPPAVKKRKASSAARSCCGTVASGGGGGGGGSGAKKRAGSSRLSMACCRPPASSSKAVAAAASVAVLQLLCMCE